MVGKQPNVFTESSASFQVHHKETYGPCRLSLPAPSLCPPSSESYMFAWNFPFKCGCQTRRGLMFRFSFVRVRCAQCKPEKKEKWVSSTSRVAYLTISEECALLCAHILIFLQHVTDILPALYLQQYLSEKTKLSHLILGNFVIFQMISNCKQEANKNSLKYT